MNNMNNNGINSLAMADFESWRAMVKFFVSVYFSTKYIEIIKTLSCTTWNQCYLFIRILYWIVSAHLTVNLIVTLSCIS